MKQMTIILSTLIMVLFIGCKPGSSGDSVIVFKQQKGDPIAEVGKTILTVEDMRADFLERQGTFRGAPNLNTEKARNDYIENQVLQEAMFQEALKLGYADRKDIMRNVKKIFVQTLVRDKLDTAQAQFEPTEAQMLEHFNKNANLYNRGEAIKVAYISIPFGSDQAKSKEIASAIHKDAMASVKNGNTREFARLAMRYATKISSTVKLSIETNETEYLEKEAFESKFGKVSFDSLKSQGDIGQVYPLVESDKAFIVMLKTGFRKALNESFAEAKSKIVKRMAYDNRNEFYKKFTEDLRKEYGIKIYKDKIAELSKGAQDKVAEKDQPAVKLQAPANLNAEEKAQDAPKE